MISKAATPRLASTWRALPALVAGLVLPQPAWCQTASGAGATTCCWSVIISDEQSRIMGNLRLRLDSPRLESARAGRAMYIPVNPHGHQPVGPIEEQLWAPTRPTNHPLETKVENLRQHFTIEGGAGGRLHSSLTPTTEESILLELDDTRRVVGTAQFATHFHREGGLHPEVKVSFVRYEELKPGEWSALFLATNLKDVNFQVPVWRPSSPHIPDYRYREIVGGVRSEVRLVEIPLESRIVPHDKHRSGGHVQGNAKTAILSGDSEFFQIPVPRTDYQYEIGFPWYVNFDDLPKIRQAFIKLRHHTAKAMGERHFQQPDLLWLQPVIAWADAQRTQEDQQ
jgi:hypothetical protein